MSQWTAADMPSQDGKIAIVTGANSGLGYFTTLELARKGTQVVMACRSREKTEPAMEAIRKEVPDARLDFMTLDLADLKSIRSFAEAFSAKYPKLDILCNNAGVMALPLCRTADGFEMQIGTNHLGHFALTGLLLDKLKTTPGARVVNTASMAHHWTRGMDLDDINWERKSYKKWDAYGKTKLANLLFTFELKRRLGRAGISVKALAAHPGYSDTNLQFAGPKMEKSFIGKLTMDIGNAIFSQPAEMGALPQLYAATMPDVQSGEYYGPDGFREIKGYPTKVGCRRAARDEEVASKLWVLSQQLTSVKYL